MHTILVEGKADKKFIEDLVKISNRINSTDFEIKIASGYTEIPKLKNLLLETHNYGGKNLIILDADDNPDEKREKIQELSKNIEIPLLLYLLPDNKNNGNLEDLLLECVKTDKQKIIDCFECYESCLKESGGYNTPNKKAKIYAYCEALLMKNKIKEAKEENRDYLNEQMWDLNTPNTNKLFTFLESIV
jgi:hypothetical protein